MSPCISVPDAFRRFFNPFPSLLRQTPSLPPNAGTSLDFPYKKNSSRSLPPFAASLYFLAWSLLWVFENLSLVSPFRNDPERFAPAFFANYVFPPILPRVFLLSGVLSEPNPNTPPGPTLPVMGEPLPGSFLEVVHHPLMIDPPSCRAASVFPFNRFPFFAPSPSSSVILYC